MELRRAGAGDEAAVGDVHVRSWQAAYRGIVPDPYLDGLDPVEWSARYTFGATGPDDPVTVMAVEGDRVLGFATTGPARCDRVAGCGELMALHADPQVWGRGVGAALVADARDRLADRGFATAVLWVLEGNDRARSFYRRDGWVDDGAAAAFEIGSVPIAEVRMRRSLSR